MVSPAPRAEGFGVDEAVDQARPIIHERLRQTERDRGLRVLFACESGSRAWGFASNDSDFDVRFIFAYSPSDYLKLRPPTDAFDIQGQDDYDLAGWDIRKTCELMRKSNGPLFEWLDSPIIYERDDHIAPQLIALRDVYFDPKKCVHHYLSLAGGVWKKYLDGNANPVRKKYLYTLRPLACVKFIEQYRKQPPTAFDAVLNAIDLPAHTREAIDRLVDDKKANRELGAGPTDDTLNTWITSMLDHGQEVAEQMPVNDLDNTKLDALISEAILGKGANA